MVAAARRWLPPAWSVVLAALLLGPALGPGYVLSYDMVWVPDLALRSDFFGVGSGLPRAVPSDAVVAVLDEIVPAMALQKAVLLGCLAGGGLGAIRLAPADSLTGQLVAVSIYQWNPFVVERLLIGHWTVLLAYAGLPWVVRAAKNFREEGRIPGALWWLLPLGSLSASAGLVTAVTLGAFGWRPHAARSNLVTVALVLGANAPWIVSGLLHAPAALTDGRGAEVFALHDAGWLPAPVAALGLGGVWNSEVLLPSRESGAALLAVLLLVALAGLGFRSWVAATSRRDLFGFAACWVLGWGAAVLTWAVPDLMAWAVTHVPGAGIARDGSRLLALCAPATAAVTAYGAASVTRWAVGPTARTAWAVALALLPVALLPDAGFGLSGRLRAVDYPVWYAETRDLVDRQDQQGPVGDVLVLPFSSFRAPAWNLGHKVLDPLGRYLAPNYVVNDELWVSGRPVGGEDPRAREVSRVLRERDAAHRSRGLASAGIGVVVHEREAGAAPSVAGEPLSRTPTVDVTAIASPDLREPPPGWAPAMAAAWLAFGAFLAFGSSDLLRRAVRHVRRHGAPLR